MRVSTTTRRIAAGALLAVPLGLLAPTLAVAHEKAPDDKDSGGHHDEQDDGPELPVDLGDLPHGDDVPALPDGFDPDALVSAVLDGAPATNVGGIGNSGSVDQEAHTGSDHDDKDDHKDDHKDDDEDEDGGGSLVSVNGVFTPATNIGGIANSGSVDQEAYAGGGSGGGRVEHGGSLIDVDLLFAPVTNIGGILNSGTVDQN